MRIGSINKFNPDEASSNNENSASSPFEKWKNTSPSVPGGIVMAAVSTLGLVALIVTLIEGFTSDYDNSIKRQNNHGPNVRAEKDATLQIEPSNTFKVANCTGLSDTLSRSQTNDIMITTAAIIFSTLVATAAIYVAAKALNCYRNSKSSSVARSSDVETPRPVENTELVSLFSGKNNGYGSDQKATPFELKI